MGKFQSVNMPKGVFRMAGDANVRLTLIMQEILKSWQKTATEKRKQRQSVPHTIVTGGERMDMEKIINVLIKLIEEQEGVNISYTLEKKESA